MTVSTYVNSSLSVFGATSTNAYLSYGMVKIEPFFSSPKQVKTFIKDLPGPLSQLLTRITEERSGSVRAALVKEKGYFIRWFSDESWEEWIENRTALGKVVAAFASFLEGFSPHPLDPKIVQCAAEESKGILERWPCRTNLAVGGLASLATGSPLPAALASLSCLDGAAAQQFPHGAGRNAATMRHTHQRRYDPMNRNQGPAIPLEELVPGNTLEKELLGWLFEIPSVFHKINTRMKEQSIARAIVQGVCDVAADHLKLNAPVDELNSALKDMEYIYWLNLVWPDYVEIFGRPQNAWNDRGYEIKVMRKTLRDHGYLSGGVQTPLQFLEGLKARGECHGGTCRW